MLRGHVSGTCCSDKSPHVNGRYHNCATSVLGTFCSREMSHGDQLVELHGTRRGDKRLQGCHDSACPCNRIYIWANQKQQPKFFALVRPLVHRKNKMTAIGSGACVAAFFLFIYFFFITIHTIIHTKFTLLLSGTCINSFTYKTLAKIIVSFVRRYLLGASSVFK